MLDVSTQAALLETIARRRGDLGVLLITHDRVLADTWCDDVDRHRVSGGGRAPS